MRPASCWIDEASRHGSAAASHLRMRPIRRPERIMKRFLSHHDQVTNLSHIRNHDICASHIAYSRLATSSMWEKITGA